jgi:hypothetical protein
MIIPGTDQISKIHNYIIILLSGSISLLPLFFLFYCHFDVDSSAGFLAFVAVIFMGMLIYESALIIEGYIIDPMIEKKVYWSNELKEIQSSPYLVNWYSFLLKGRKDKEYLHSVIEQIAFRFLFWISIVISGSLFVLTICLIFWSFNPLGCLLLGTICLILFVLLVVRICELAKFLFILRELSLIENPNVISMIDSNKKCCCHNHKICDSEKIQNEENCHNKCCHIQEDFPKEGECVGVLLSRYRYLYFLQDTFPFIFMFVIGFWLIKDEWILLKIVGLISLAIGVYELFRSRKKRNGSIVYYSTGIVFLDSSVKLNESDVFVSIGSNIQILGSNTKYSIPTRFRNHPEKLVSFLNMKQKELMTIN